MSGKVYKYNLYRVILKMFLLSLHTSKQFLRNIRCTSLILITYILIYLCVCIVSNVYTIHVTICYNISFRVKNNFLVGDFCPKAGGTGCTTATQPQNVKINFQLLSIYPMNLFTLFNGNVVLTQSNNDIL